ncbi:hypothetical protein [Fodinibius sp. Rm-B-1B1-1]|uniref:hypothetical protein n=1 Tax=Fodinibius alkaliphilus TaxID=3140241 RepID=UPI003159FE13
MVHQLKEKLITEFVWLLGIIFVSAALEYVIIELFDLHPILSVKIQALIGLIIIAYIIRMITRMGKKGIITFEDEEKGKSEEHFE